MGRVRIELAWTAPVTIAAIKIEAAQMPLGFGLCAGYYPCLHVSVRVLWLFELFSYSVHSISANRGTPIFVSLMAN